MHNLETKFIFKKGHFSKETAFKKLYFRKQDCKCRVLNFPTLDRKFFFVRNWTHANSGLQ